MRTRGCSRLMLRVRKGRVEGQNTRPGPTIFRPFLRRTTARARIAVFCSCVKQKIYLPVQSPPPHRNVLPAERATDRVSRRRKTKSSDITFTRRGNRRQRVVSVIRAFTNDVYDLYKRCA